MNEMDKMIADDAEARIEWEIPTLAKLSVKAAEDGSGSGTDFGVYS
ncbi:hypothetical protein [Tistrella mobilis]